MDILGSIEGLEWLYLCLVLIGASVVHGTLGMGFPLIFTALAAIVIDVKSAVFISLVPSILINFRCLTEGYDWRGLIRRFAPLALLAGAGSVIGTKILLDAPPGPIKLILILSIAFYLLLDRLKNRRFAWIQTYPTAAMVVFALAAGIIGGITNAMGPILIIYFLENHIGKDETVQGLNLCFVVGKFVQLFMFYSAGDAYSSDGWLIIAAVSVLVFALLLVGIRIRQRFEVETYRRLLKHALAIIALVLLGQLVI